MDLSVVICTQPTSSGLKKMLVIFIPPNIKWYFILESLKYSFLAEQSLLKSNEHLSRAWKDYATECHWYV